MLSPKAVLETVLYVDDLDAAAAFYEMLLQLAPVHSDERMKVLRVSEQNFLLLFKTGATKAPISVPGGTIPAHDGSGRMHVAFSVGDEEMVSWSERLRTKGVSIESTVNWPSGERSLYFRDPAGILVELATPNLWKS